MRDWIHAPDVPPSWAAGKQVWQWTNTGAMICTMPVNYSRNPLHCGGIWFKLIEDPGQPSHEQQREASAVIDAAGRSPRQG